MAARFARGRLLALLLAALANCVALPDPGEEEQRCVRICEKTAQCPGIDQDAQCKERCMASHFPEKCADAMEATTCAELEQGSTSKSAWVVACYPRCSPDGVACQGDRILSCNGGYFSQRECSFVCRDLGGKYSGVCAKERNGQFSPTGLPQCWCD